MMNKKRDTIVTQIINELGVTCEVKTEPLVRCRDCENYDPPYYCKAWNNTPGWPKVEDDCFCFLAERRQQDG